MNGRDLLVIEDHVGTRHALRMIFRRSGYLIREAETVAEALAALDPVPYCILLDLMLPDGCGETVLQKVREAELPTRVIVCTGAHDGALLARVNQWRPDALLYKPVDVRDVYKVCEAVR